MEDFQTFIKAVEDGNLEKARSSFQPDFLEKTDLLWGWRPIHYACRDGLLNIVKFLFEKKCDIECETEEGQRPIHWACRNGHLDVVKFLLENKCSLECETEGGWRPIHLACWGGHREIVEILIQSNCELDYKTQDGETPLEISRRKGKKDCEKFLNEILKRRKSFDCVTKNDAEALGALYSPGILVMKDPETDLSLLEAALNSNTKEIIDYILDKPVDAEELSALENYMKNSDRHDAVHLIQECLLYRSIRFHNADGFHLSCSAKTINEHGKLVKSSFLEVAAKYGCKPFIHSLLEKSVYNEDEWTTAENLAILNGQAEIAEAISKRKILLSQRTDENFTALHSAVCDNDPDMVKYILERDLVNPDFNNEVVGTSLALAYMMCYRDCIDVLELFKVDVNTQNKYSQSPLHEAIASGMTDHCSYLISRAVDIDKPGFMGFTCLQCAVIKGCEELCKELLKKGADCLRYVENLQQSAFNEKVLPISNKENAVTLCAKIHRKIYPCLLQALDSEKVKCSEVQTVMTKGIFHVAMLDCDPKTLMSLFAKSYPAVQQLVIEDLLNDFASTDNYNDFVNLLETEIAEPKLFPNGETLFTNLLKQQKLRYCGAIINCKKNKKCIDSANSINETPLQICIEIDLFDLMAKLILNCDDKSDLGFNWHIPLIQLFKKLSMSTNDEVDQKLMDGIKNIILRGGDIYKKTHGDMKNIDYCTRLDFKDQIKLFQKGKRPKERDDKNICGVCLDKEVNCVFECGHTFCMDCGTKLYRCAFCNSEDTHPKNFYIN